MQRQDFLLAAPLSLPGLRGFSLVELSIVLVILGLLTGGILTGQNLIRAAELRSVTTEFAQYQSAVMQFRERYFALPGDMPNATLFWGSATCPGAAGDERTDGTTCNGNGDGSLLHNSSGGAQNEYPGFWQHLALAGLIEGNYTGVTTGANHYSNGTAPGENIPASKLANGVWLAYSIGNQIVSSTVYVEGNYGNNFFFGRDANIFNGVNNQLLTPTEAWGIDKKIDDGYPFTGNVVTGEGISVACLRTATGGVAGTSSSQPRATQGFVYAVWFEDPACYLIFKNAF